jgi:hypothetical protein
MFILTTPVLLPEEPAPPEIIHLAEVVITLVQALWQGI